jgi:hypothetical protein
MKDGGLAAEDNADQHDHCKYWITSEAIIIEHRLLKMIRK